MNPAALPTVTVLLPIDRDEPHFRAAAQSILAQSHPALELIIIRAGIIGAAASVVEGLAKTDRRVRVIERPRGINLAAALNAGLREAKTNLIARMDGDDLSHPERLTRQIEWMAKHPDVAAAGTWYERIDSSGGSLGMVAPPCEPDEIRWRLLLGNVFAHGSMILRRDAVMTAGGYDESLDRAQDYDLWLRLSREHKLGNVPEVLYSFRTKASADTAAMDSAQPRIASSLMRRAWAALPSTDHAAPLEETLAHVLAGDPGAIEVIESRLRERPTRDDLTAWLWADHLRGMPSREAMNAARLSRLREISAALSKQGVARVTLYGAGEHSRWLIANAPRAQLPIAGVIDDSARGREFCGFTVASPNELPSDAVVLISSDRHEETIARRAMQTLTPRGIRVYRFYGSGDAEPTPLIADHPSRTAIAA